MFLKEIKNFIEIHIICLLLFTFTARIHTTTSSSSTRSCPSCQLITEEQSLP